MLSWGRRVLTDLPAFLDLPHLPDRYRRRRKSSLLFLFLLFFLIVILLGLDVQNHLHEIKYELVSREQRKQNLTGWIGTSKASLYMATCVWRPVRLKSSSMKSSDTSAKYSWPRREQKEEIQDSGEPEEVDILQIPAARGDVFAFVVGG